MIQLHWNQARTPTATELTSHGLGRLFAPLDAYDRVPRSLRGYLRAEARDWQEAQQKIATLEALGLAPTGAIELDGVPEQSGGLLVPEPLRDFRPPFSHVVHGDEDDFFDRQGYLLDSASGGFGAIEAWRWIGGRGSGIRLVDVELGRAPRHRDLPTIDAWLPPVETTHDAHPPQVLGVVCAHNDRRGVTGFASDVAAPSVVQVRLSDPARHLLNVLRFVGQRTKPPAVVLVEVAMRRPDRHDDTLRLPVEAWSVGRLLLRAMVDRGLYPVVGAANGGVDLDDIAPWSAGGRSAADSGAILVAAAHPRTGLRVSSSNHGERIDLNAWGADVFTCGRSNAYQPNFRDTSAAASIVAGVVACLAGILLAARQRPLAPRQMRDLLVQTGHISQNGIGRKPDLARAIAILRAAGRPLRSSARHAPSGTTSMAA